MKKMTKKMIALFMTLLMVAAMLPITASAMQYARIVVELKEPYYGENLAEILPEIEIEAAYPFIEGYAFTVYFDHASDEDAEAAAEKLASNPIVKSATYCPYNETETYSLLKFEIKLADGFFAPDPYVPADLGKIFSDIKIVDAKMWSKSNFDIYTDVTSVEEASILYDKIQANPFVKSAYFYLSGTDRGFITVGTVSVKTTQKYTEEEVTALLSETGIGTLYNSYEGFQFMFLVKDATLKGTLETVEKLKQHPNVAEVGYTDDFISPAVMPSQVKTERYQTPEKPEVTVETALAALRITAGLSEVKNGVYDYRLADAIWQYDCDGDKVITVTDALSLLRIAAGIAA